jgi:hypothetical protein
MVFSALKPKSHMEDNMMVTKNLFLVEKKMQKFFVIFDLQAQFTDENFVELFHFPHQF